MYRIKTFEEFGKKRPIGWNLNGHMDFLYGRKLTEEEFEILSVNGWGLNCTDIIEYDSDEIDDIIGAIVTCKYRTSMEKYTFEVLYRVSEENYVVYSKEWKDGHDGSRHLPDSIFPTLTNRRGCQYVPLCSLTLLTKNKKDELPSKDSGRIKRGKKIDPNRKTVSPARASRPVGSGTTSCRFRGKVGRGTLKHNRIQSYRMC